ncbi:hypothetical protein C8J27_11521 [Rhodobacter aestuarii]|uniref:hypothetical protein n=1 Tax=Rhodobacter TaxID=1060 RepID=UPI00097104D5|nr:MULTISPECIES: hypothetical protein [Rhodobacter]PTV93508.1 hypothetical protein C8J27_11521 [Rhodobacter aestuarii]
MRLARGASIPLNICGAPQIPPKTVRSDTLKNENPGALAGATGAEFEASIFKTKEYRLRAEWARAVWFALDHCHPEDAAQICAGFLDSLSTQGPSVSHPFGMTSGEAMIWADCAPIHELAAYVAAGLDRLRGLALAKSARKRLFWALWQGFDPEDRRAFLAQVKARAVQ